MKLQRLFFTKTRILFILLAFLAIGQVIWWSYLLISQQDFISQLDPNLIEKTDQFKRMVLFETLFFIFFWSLSIWFIYKTFLAHEDLRKAHNIFLGGISHELKTPIANVSLCLETLTRPQLEDSKKAQYLDRAQKALQSLLEQVENLLSFTSAMSLNLDKENINIRNLFEQIFENYTAQKKILPHEFDIQIDDRFTIKESPIALNIILKNIIDNSIKYTQHVQKRKISIFSSESNGKKQITVADNGIGMTAEEIKKCSEAFWRSNRAVEKAYSGTGMGLTLLSEISNKQGIHYSLKSSGADKGLEVTLEWMGNS